MNEIQRELNAGNVAFRNGLIMQWMPYIASVVKSHSLGTRDDLHNAVVYIAKHVGTYNGSCHIAGWIKLCALGGLRTAYMRKKIDTVGGDSTLRVATPHNPRSILMNKEYKATRKRALGLAMSNLGIREQYLIKQHFLEKRTMTDLAEEEGISPQGVRQHIARTLEHMRRDIEHYYDDLR